MADNSQELAQPGVAPKRIRTSRTLGIVAAVLSGLGFLILALCTFGVGSSIPSLLEDTEYTDSVDFSEFNALLAQVGFGELSQKEGVLAVMMIMELFLGFGALISLVSLLAGVSMVVGAKSRKGRTRSFAAGMVGGIASILTMRLVSGILLLVASIKVYRQNVEDAGGYDAYYGDGKHLGFLRFVEFACIAEIIMNVTLLLFVTKSDVYDGSWWINFIMLLMMSVTLWIIWNRKSNGANIICGMVAAYLVISVVYSVVVGEFRATQFVFDYFWPLVMLFYFGLSKQARAVLSRPFDFKSREAQLKEEEQLWNLKSPLFWRNLLLYFCIFSVVGHWMEWSVCWLIRWGIVPGTYDPNSGIWRDMLNPFFVYGIAFVFIGLLLFPLKNKLLQVFKGNVPKALLCSFILNTLFCAAIELVLGLACNQPDPVTGKLPLWDYSNMAFNFMGQICLLNTTFFGVMATIMTWLVYPLMEKAFSKIPRDIMNIVTVVVIMFFILVVSMYVINLNLDSLASIGS